MKARLALLLTLALSASLAPAARAADAPPGLGFGIRAEGFKSYFIFDAKRGQTIRARLLVQNTTGVGRPVFLRAADVTTAVTGGLDYGRTGAQPKREGRWIKLGTQTARVPPLAAVAVPFTVRVPASAKPGDHLAGIVAYGKQPPQPRGKGFRLKVFPRLAIAVQTKVPGKRTPHMDLQDVQIRIQPTGAFLGLELVDDGNTLIRKTTGRLRVSQKGRQLFRRTVKIDAFVPRTRITFPVPWEGVPVEGKYGVRGVLRPQGAPAIRIDTTVDFGSKRIEEFREETGRKAISTGTPSWVWLALAIAALALLLLLITLLRMRRNRDRPEAPAVPPAVARTYAPPPPAPVAPPPPAPVAPPPASTGGPVNINTASIEELMQLPGVGRQAATRIVQHRDEYGDFGSLDELSAIEGFHQERIQRLAAQAEL